MRVVIAGGSGFVGNSLVRQLLDRGDEVIVLTRDPSRVRAGRGVAWRPPLQGGWSEEVTNADAVINLAGENIGEGRWTEERKRRLTSSRLDATRALVEAMRRDAGRARTFISASAIGYYGLHGDETLDESAPRGAGFLAELTEEWERAAREGELVARVVIPRFGVVLDPRGGALPKMMVPFRFGAGGPVGDGRQWMSWVALADVIRFLEWATTSAATRGVYNVTAPEPVRNREFATMLGRAMHRPAALPAPAFALRLAFGRDMADEVLLGGQRVVPARGLREGFTFDCPRLEPCLERLLSA
jgi:uncharacterized protein (TIGR01777 family)